MKEQERQIMYHAGYIMKRFPSSREWCVIGIRFGVRRLNETHEFADL